MKLKSSQFMHEKEFPFWIRRYIHDQHNIPPVHGHDFIELVYVVEGEGEHVFEGESYEVTAGDVFIINPGEVHTYAIEPAKRLEIINCLFMPSLIDDVWLRELGVSQSMDYFYVHPFLDQTERFHHALNLRPPEAQKILSLLEAMSNEFELGKNGFSALIRLQLIQLLIMLSRIYSEQQTSIIQASLRHQERKRLVQRICGYIERHYDQKLSLEMLSGAFLISPRHLNRVFKEQTGKTVIEAVHQIRIEKAKHLLTQSDEKVISIALKVGYEDPAFFTKLFTREVGRPPGKFRLETLAVHG